jgi:hemerythrin-like domain-containing protein
MNVIGHLREEHRVIENTLNIFEAEIKKIREQHRIDPISIDISIDFVRTYTDLAHHGKEENILFHDLGKKNLSANHTRIMNELMAEHQHSRTIVEKWIEATKRYFAGEDNSQEIIDCLQELTTFYPLHILKENNYFFNSIADYFSQEEHKKLIREFEEHDDKVLHWKYRKIESVLEERLDDRDNGAWRC